MHSKMEELLDTKYIDACVTVNYGFPIGVSSVGRAITPSFGKEMYIATTTGTASMHRVEAMVKNALHGLIVAKTMGIQEPSIGILNLDGARQVERALRELNQNGYQSILQNQSVQILGRLCEETICWRNCRCCHYRYADEIS